MASKKQKRRQKREQADAVVAIDRSDSSSGDDTLEADTLVQRIHAGVVKHRWSIAVAGMMVLVAVWLRCGVAVWELVFFPDSTVYLALAKDIRACSVLQSDFELYGGFTENTRTLPPVFSALVAIASFVFRNWESAAIVVSIVASLLTIVPMYILARRCHSTTAGCVATGLAIFHPFVLSYSSEILTDAVYTSFYGVAAVVGLYAIERGSSRLAALFGAICGIACLTREVALSWLPVTVMCGVVFGLMVRPIPWRQAVRLIGVASITMFIVLLPYMTFLKIHGDHFTVSMRLHTMTRVDHLRTLAFKNSSSLSAQEPTTGVQRLHRAVSKNLRNGWQYAVNYSHRFGTVLTVALFLSGVISISAFRSKERRLQVFRDGFVWLWGLQTIAVYAVTTPRTQDVRYMYPLVVPTLVLAAVGVVRMGEFVGAVVGNQIGFKVDQLRHRRLGGLVLSCTLVATCLVMQKAQVALLIKRGDNLSWAPPVGIPEAAADALSREPSLAGLSVLNRNPITAYYFQAARSERVAKTGRDFKTQLTDGSVDLFVADSSTLRRTRPAFVDFAFARRLPVNAKVVYSRLFPERKRVITVFDVRKSATYTFDVHNVSELLAKAQEFYRANYLWDAEIRCQAVLQHAPDNIEALKILVAAHTMYRRYVGWPNDGSPWIAICERYLALKPDDVDVVRWRSQLRAHYGKKSG